MNRKADIQSFYEQMDILREICGGYRTLATCDGKMDWPKRGVYFFFEPGEERCESGSGLRIVRIGTHAVSVNSKARLWNRLSTHRGNIKTGGGNHRGSIFRQLVGYSLAEREGSFHKDTWLDQNASLQDVCLLEYPLESAVSEYIGTMPFLWVEVDDEPSKDSQRSYIERNAIALLSNVSPSANEIIDAPSPHWLGRYCHKEDVRTSGLWNSNHTHEQYDPAFLATLTQYITAM